MVGFLSVGLVTLNVRRAALPAPDGLLHMTMLDVGNGEAFLVQNPTGRYLLLTEGLAQTGCRMD